MSSNCRVRVLRLRSPDLAGLAEVERIALMQRFLRRRPVYVLQRLRRSQLQHGHLQDSTELALPAQLALCNVAEEGLRLDLQCMLARLRVSQVQSGNVGISFMALQGLLRLRSLQCCRSRLLLQPPVQYC